MLHLKYVKICLLAVVMLIYACNGSKDGFQYKLLPVKINEKWGYIDNQGKIIINPQYDEAFLFSDNMALIKIDNKYGYIDSEGKLKVNPLYISATSFKDGIALCVAENGYPTFINKKGEIVFTVNEADECWLFSEGLAAFKTNYKWGFIDKSGKIIINAQYDRVGDFSEGLAVFGNANNSKTQFGYINKKGEIEINMQFDEAYSFKDGLALVKINDKYGFIDKKGKFIINAQFDFATSFFDGLSKIKSGDKYGFIDKKGTIIINPQFDKIDNFNEGLALVVSTDKKVGFVNKKGLYEINAQFDDASDFKNGLAAIKMNGKYGFIDKTGKIIINPQFDDVFSSLNNNAHVLSDYFNTNSLTAFFEEKSDKETFRGVSKNTNFGAISNDIHKNDKLLESSQNSATVKIDKEIDNYAKIENIKYNFSEKIYTVKPTYQYLHHWGNYQTGTQKDMNFKALVKSLEVEMYLFGKASGKNDKITRVISNTFESFLNVKAVENTDGFSIDGQNMKVKIFAERKMLTGKIFVNIIF